ncbi:MAG: DUF481 domain-containing protein [Myxococcales bacterium]|nr:DUF481 domain-containing protein [Myxococcales bacterium]
MWPLPLPTVRRFVPACALTFALSLLAMRTPPACAQVNTESLRLNKARSGLGGLADAAFALKKGNVDFLSLEASGRVEYTQGRHSPFLHGTLALAERNGQRFIYNGFAHARWTAMWWPRLGTEVFSQIQFNRFWRLQQRALWGAGLRVWAVHAERFELFVATGYMLERELLQGSAVDLAPHPKDALNHRSTSYATARYNLKDDVFVTNTVFFQPRFAAPSDFRLLDEAALEVALTEALSLVVAVSVLHDSQPPPGVEKTDLNLQNKLRARF